MAGIHDGHRTRLRNKLTKFGFECLEDHEKLEYLLYAFIPRRDTNPIAHELIKTFGSFRNVLKAEVESLASVKGMTENAALFLHLLPEVFSAYLACDDLKAFTSVDACAKYMIGKIGIKKEEHFIVLYMNDDGMLIKMETITDDKRRSIVINRDKLVAEAVKCKAKVVVIGHNHPNGDMTPSEEDVESTNRIAQALGMVGVRLADHIILSETAYYSMAQNGEIVAPVNLNGSINQFAQGLIRRENDIKRLIKIYRV